MKDNMDIYAAVIVHMVAKCAVDGLRTVWQRYTATVGSVPHCDERLLRRSPLPLGIRSAVGALPAGSIS